MNGKEAQRSNKTVQLVDTALGIVVERLAWQERSSFWLSALQTHNSLPKETSRERRFARGLIAKTSAILLENPDKLTTAIEVWNIQEGNQIRTGEQEIQFSALVKNECQSLIKEKWQEIIPEQLAELVKLYADNDDPSQDLSVKLLRDYFRGPNSRNRRIDAYYRFVLGVFDLPPQSNGFREGMKIALFATDILPKKPGLTEQSIISSLPYKEDEYVFKEALISNHAVNQTRFMGIEGLEECFDERREFVQSGDVREELRKKQERIFDDIGNDGIREINNKMLSFYTEITAPLSEEKIQSLKNTWPYNIAFDESDPLTQKLKRVQLQLASDAQTH